MLWSSVVPLPHKKYTATWRSAVLLPHKSFGFKSCSSAFAHRISAVPIPHKEYTLTFNINMNMHCNCDELTFVKHFSWYIFWRACLVFWSRQANRTFKIMKILLLMAQFYNAPSMWDLIVSVPDHCLSFYFVTLPRGRRALTIGAHTFVQNNGKRNVFGPIIMAKIIGYNISTIFLICMCKRRRPKQVQLISWNALLNSRTRRVRYTSRRQVLD